MLKFAINRLDMQSPVEFAASAVKAERLGWHIGLLPTNPLAGQDPYICLAMAAQATTKLELGTLLDNPVVRHPSVLAGSIATVAGFAPGRIQCGLGTGDTAVRFNGLKPATVDAMTEAVIHVRKLLAGELIEVGAARPARLRHHTSVPVWVAAQGPRTLKMAGAHADGVYLRVGTHPENIKHSWDLVCQGAKEAGRDIGEVGLALIFHTAYSEDPAEARLIANAMAAGYYEYSPILFERVGFNWNGPDVEKLRQQAWPDFHHHRDPVKAGELVDFLPDEAADSFALHGTWDQIETQLKQVLALELPVSIILPHPVLAYRSSVNFIQECAKNLIPRFA